MAGDGGRFDLRAAPNVGFRADRVRITHTSRQNEAAIKAKRRRLRYLLAAKG
jgi:hypothetical protein